VRCLTSLIILLVIAFTSVYAIEKPTIAVADLQGRATSQMGADQISDLFIKYNYHQNSLKNGCL
jgi:hypothetical protein